ncbi:helicase [Archaeoglobales archaeon]|nr:MAG: helicase [Archaeoglobales archaeon]
MEIKSGTIIESPLFPEPVKVEKMEMMGEYIRIVGATINSNQHIDTILPKDEFSKLKVFTYDMDFTANAEDVFLALEAYRFRLASLFDPILAMNVSRVDPLPHQIEAVYGYILKLPRIRFLIADDPGAGKTIMAGLVIKELKLRGLARRILIVVPGHLKDQWRRELKERFSENFVIVDRHTMNAHFGENVWERENQVITSMDFAKQDHILSTLANVQWDLVIVDEAHKMAAYKYGNKIKKTARYRLGEVLSRNTEHLLFLTATPHKGDPENFRLLLDLLEPGFFATQEMLLESIRRRENPLFIRRLKEDLRDFEGRPLFLPRHVFTIKFNITDEERALYNELSKYVITQYNKALKSEKKRNVAFALIILQRRMASSVYALKRSLERRKKRLEEILRKGIEKEEKVEVVDIEEFEDYEEKERWKIEQKWETLSVAETKEELEKEIKTIERLIEMADRIIKNESEVKLKELKKLMESEQLKNQKILIFTESRDTLEYLYDKIRSWGYSVNYIHGGMSLEERIKAEKEFKHNTQIMVATEAAGEGINLQFCNIMINYDIPWNPNRLEQRMGRIHRYGQTKEVFIYNLVNEDTREGMVLAKLLDKLREIREALGDKVFDVIGEIFPGKDFYQLVVEAAANARSIDEILATIEAKLDEEYIAKVKDALGESLATRFIDYTRIREMFEKVREFKLIPEYTEAFFVKAFQRAGGKITKVGNFYRVDSIPYEIRRIAVEDSFKNTWGTLASRYRKITFDKEIAMRDSEAEFISFGHPLFEAVLEWVLRNYLKDCMSGAVFKDPSGIYNGVIFFFEGEVKDGKGTVAGRKLFAIYKDERTGQVREVNPSIIWDLAPHKGEFTLNEEWRKEAERFAIEALMKFKNELLNERLRQAQIKEKYGVKSLETLIRNYDMKLIEYEERRKKGEKMDLAIQMAERRKKEYERALQELKWEIEREKNLSVSMPKLIGVAKVVAGDEMVSDAEIERIGMEVAMAYERMHGRNPEDVSALNLGYDIRSIGENEVRYIEVKARATTGDVALTPNEWFKAKRFGDQYYLYIVENAAINPMLYIIRNPAEKLEVIEKVESVRFVVPYSEWKWKARVERV